MWSFQSKACEYFFKGKLEEIIFQGSIYDNIDWYKKNRKEYEKK